nr:hypothetical protein [Tanacetum cinerariifolium]
MDGLDAIWNKEEGRIKGQELLLDESVDEGIPEKEPRFNDEKADVQRELEESLKSIYDAPRGSLPPVVIREPESGKYQPLLEVYGKGKEKSTDEQTIRWNLMRMCQGLMWEFKVTARLDQTLASKMKARLDQTLMNLEATNVSTQPHPKQIDEGFTTTAYPKVKENLKLTVEEQVDALPSTNNEDKVFNLGILIHENLSEVTVQATPDKNVKKIAISHASLIIEDFNPPLYELPFHKEVLGSETLLLFSSEMRKKFSNQGFSLLNEFIHLFS